MPMPSGASKKPEWRYVARESSQQDPMHDLSCTQDARGGISK
jgi:hypothetical protein